MYYKKTSFFIFLGVVSISLVFLGFKVFYTNDQNKEQADTRPTVRSAYELALPLAIAWRADAKLAFVTSEGPVGETGRANIWRLIFTSLDKKLKEKGFLVVASDYTVTSANEIFYTGVGADFPENIISPEEAIGRVRGIMGYQYADILGVEAIYGPGGKVWYWGVKTSKGTVSTKAVR